MIGQTCVHRRSGRQSTACRRRDEPNVRLRLRIQAVTHACECSRQPDSLVGSYRYQEVGNDITPKWAIYQFRALKHLVSQLDHACSRLGLCGPEVFGRPLGICEIVAVGAPMQTRPQTASLIAYKFG